MSTLNPGVDVPKSNEVRQFIRKEGVTDYSFIEVRESGNIVHSFVDEKGNDDFDIIGHYYKDGKMELFSDWKETIANAQKEV